MAEENIFEAATDYAINERMSKMLLGNRQYQKLQKRIDKQFELFDRLNLNRKQWLVIDRLLSLYAENGALYGRITYQQGYRDCVAMLHAMDLIKAS